MNRLLKVALCVALFSMCAVAQVNLNGAGATFPYPIYSKWFSEFHKANPNIQINYQSIGSGGGIRQLMEGTVDFGASDGPMTDEQLAEAKFKILHVPTVLGSVVPAYNIAGVAQELKFTPDVLAGIFLGKIKNWNDPAIAKANPGVKFPNQQIVVAHRSDGSGTTYVFTDYLSKVSPEWQKTVGKNTSVKWPTGIGCDRLHRVDLRGAEQYPLRHRPECRRCFRKGFFGFDNCGGSVSQDAGRFPRFHHQCAWQKRLPDCQLHLAARANAVQGCEQR